MNWTLNTENHKKKEKGNQFNNKKKQKHEFSHTFFFCGRMKICIFTIFIKNVIVLIFDSIDYAWFTGLTIYINVI